METAQTGKLNNGFSVSTEQCEYMFVAGRVFTSTLVFGRCPLHAFDISITDGLLMLLPSKILTNTTLMSDAF